MGPACAMGMLESWQEARQGTRAFSSRCAELPGAPAPPLPLPCKLPAQFGGWLCAGPKRTSSAVAELDQLLRMKKYTCHIPLFGREMVYTGESKSAELSVVCSWVLLAPQLVLGAKCSRDRRRPGTVEQVPSCRQVLCLPGTCWGAERSSEFLPFPFWYDLRALTGHFPCCTEG